LVSVRSKTNADPSDVNAGGPLSELARLTANGDGASNMHSTSSSSWKRREPRYLTPFCTSRELFSVARAAIGSNSISVTPGQ
jgi:hypothetical protein